jgi:ribosome hibernation promoting factor
VNLILSGRGVDLDEPLKRYATEKLTRVERFFDRIIKMEVELRHERNPRVKNPDRVEITVKTPGETLRVHGEGADHFAAIDKAVDRLETQIKRFKERLIDGHRNHHHARQEAAPPLDGDVEDAVEILRYPPRVSKPLTPEEAALELDTRGIAFLLFTNAESMRAAVIFRRDDGGFGLTEHEG